MRRRFYEVFLLVAWIAGCSKGSGSEVGATLPPFPAQTFSGQVFAADGTPIVSVSVNLDGTAISAATDKSGRFRIEDPPNGDFTLIVDGRTGAANGVGELFPKWQIPVTVSGNSSPTRNIFLPSLTPDPNIAASKTVAVGSALSGSDDIAISGAGVSLILNGAQLDWENPAEHSGETSVKLTAAIVATNQVPFPLSSSTDGALNSPLVLWIDPAELVFSTAATLTFTSSYFPNGAGSVKLYRYDDSTADWVSTGTVSIAGGVMTATSAVTNSGFIAIASPCSATTTITGHMIDEASKPLKGVLINASSGKSAVSDSNGSFSISSVCAEDGNATPLTVNIDIAASTQHMPFFLRKSVALVPGANTALGDILLRTVASGRVDFMLVERGVVVPEQEVALGSALNNFGSKLKTDSGGVVRFFDVPKGTNQIYRASASYPDYSLSPIRMHTGSVDFAFGGLFGSGLYIGPNVAFNYGAIDRNLTITVLREDSEAPIEGAFVMMGTNPSTVQQGFTNSIGQIALGASGTVDITAGVKTTVPAGGGGFDQIRLTSFQTIKGVKSNFLIIRLPAAKRLDALPLPYDPFAKVSGSAEGLTDPTVTTPLYGPGTYSVDLKARARGDARELFPVFEEASDFDLLTPVGPDVVIDFLSSGTPTPDFEKAIPTPGAYLVGVERDSASATSGHVTKFGITALQNMNPGSNVSASLPFDFILGGNTLDIAAPGLDASLAGSVEANLAVEFSNGKGALLGDWSDANLLTFDSNSGAGTVKIAPLSGLLSGGAYRLNLQAEDSSGGIMRRQSVFMRSTGNTLSANFLTIPAFSVPTAGGSDFNPTSTGISWTASSTNSMDRAKLTRSTTTVESGVTIRDDLRWDVFTPNGDHSVIFPTLPTTSHSLPVPTFFASGQSFTLEIRSMSASLFEYQPYVTHSHQIRISELNPQAESLYQGTVTIP